MYPQDHCSVMNVHHQYKVYYVVATSIYILLATSIHDNPFLPPRLIMDIKSLLLYLLKDATQDKLERKLGVAYVAISRLVAGEDLDAIVQSTIGAQASSLATRVAGNRKATAASDAGQSVVEEDQNMFLSDIGSSWSQEVKEWTNSMARWSIINQEVIYC